MYSDSTERSFAGALVFFLVMALSAYVLLVTALVFWLAELLGSLPLAAVLLGGFTLLIALLTYQLAVRTAARTLGSRLRGHANRPRRVSARVGIPSPAPVVRPRAATQPKTPDCRCSPAFSVYIPPLNRASPTRSS